MRADKVLQDFIRIQRSEGHGWTQAEAAEAAGLSTIRWRQIERGGQVPLATLARVLYALGADPEMLRELGYGELADAVKMRRDFLAPGDLPAFIDGEAEAHLWATPGVSAAVRRALILHLRTLRRAEADPVARALLGLPDG